MASNTSFLHLRLPGVLLFLPSVCVCVSACRTLDESDRLLQDHLIPALLQTISCVLVLFWALKGTVQYCSP